jgi:hypothetical protein
MGTFGLSDYLSRRDIPVRILNLGVYRETDAGDVLSYYLDIFDPTHIAILFHWQETTEGFLSIGEAVKSHRDNARIITGGFTAGYFGENLLKKCEFLDYVIRGDPEKPLELLLNGTELSQVPNLIYRSPSGVRSTGVNYFIDRETFSSIAFCELTYLYDHRLYIENIEKKLGFPVCLGRGCAFSCRYCGGSCRAYKLHSGRSEPVTRHIDAVIADLKRLKDFTRKIYLCHENDRGSIIALFEAMKKEETLMKTFQLNYGAWQLLDREFLELYKTLFVSPGKDMPVVELSPEVFDDKARRKIKHRSVYYSIQELKENIKLINSHLGDRINVAVFFSRYHDSVSTYAGMRKEIEGIYRLRHDLLFDQIRNVHIAFDHLSTDVGSRYWEDHVKNPKDIETLISAMRRLKAQEQYSYPVDNLCVYVPDTLTNEEVLRCELLIFLLEILEQHFHEMFHILFKCLNDSTIDLIEGIVIEKYAKKQCNVFKSLDYCELLDSVRQEIAVHKSFSERIPFIADLTDLNIRKAKYRRRSIGLRSFYQIERPKLNMEFISTHEHDYLDLSGFMNRLTREGAGNLRPDKTIFLFLTDEILSMNYETYALTLKEFEDGISVRDYYALMEKRSIFSTMYHRNLIKKMFQSNILY